MDLERHRDHHAGPRRLAVQNQEVVVVDAVLNGAPPGVLEAVLYGELRFTPRQTHHLAVHIAVAQAGIVQGLRELHEIGAMAHGPFAGIGDLIEVVVVIAAVIRLAQRTHADLDEGSAGFGFAVTQFRKLFHRAGMALHGPATTSAPRYSKSRTLGSNF